MALEITGLAIGVAALVGSFKDCIDVYGTIVAARSLTDDAEVLNTKLDVERMMLLQWADRAGLTEPEKYDRRLDDADLKQTGARVLQNIKRLLSDSKLLKDRYGLVDYEELRHDIVLDDKLEIRAGSARLKNFTERLNRLSLHIEMPRTEHSVAKRFKWVVRDGEKFTSLMNDLSYFVSRLDALLPAQGQSARTMTEEDLAQIRSIPQLKVVIQASAGFQPQIAVVAQQAIRFLNQGRVLDRLWFRWIDNRKTSISDRHTGTLDWALGPPEHTMKWHSLAEWLGKGSGLYWLAGKAGSGKSTLMKFLSDHHQTTSLLKEWAGQSEIVTLQFFFYALGRLEQKSQDGILRSILFQFLDKHRDLIGQVLPAMWKEASITEDKEHDLEIPAISEMETSLLQVFESGSADKRFFILIDGLDEFEGKHATMAAFLARLELLPNVKILVSSRPLPVFVSAFDHAPKMYLQDLTNRDIEVYIDDTILHHPHIKHLTYSEPEMSMKVTRLLIDKASGVFLWVVLACQSILRGLDEYDTVPELMSRVMELPPELDDFFRQTIASMDPRKRDQSARLLRLVFDGQDHRIPTIGLAIVEEQGLRADFMGPTAVNIDDKDLVKRCQRLEGRIRSRCSGLIEIQKERILVPPSRASSIEEEALFYLGFYPPYSASKIVFMHRSLYEFLCGEGIWEWEILRVDNECGQFAPHALLASLWTQLIPHPKWGGHTGDHAEQCSVNALVYNLRAAANNCPARLLATNLSRLQGLFAGGRLDGCWGYPKLWLPHEPNCREGYEDLSLGLALAAELGMASLVRMALEDPDGLRRALIPPDAGQVQDCSSFSTCPTGLYRLNRDRAGAKYTDRSTVFPLLYHAACRPFLALLRNLNQNISEVSEAVTLNVEAVKYLLEKGHDPNEGFFTDEDEPITTPWIEWLDLIRPGGWGFINSDSSSLKDWATGVEQVHQRGAFTLLLVDAGADLGAPGTEMCNMVDEGLSIYISNAAQRIGRTSVELARSDDLWLRVRDRILSLRRVECHQDVRS